MTVLVLGGTGFVGRHVTRQLAAAGPDVTVFHRGETAPSLPEDVSRIHGSRDDQAALRDALDAATPEVGVDAIAYTALDTRPLRTGLGFAEPVAHAEALSRTIARSRDDGGGPEG